MPSTCSRMTTRAASRSWLSIAASRRRCCARVVERLVGARMPFRPRRASRAPRSRPDQLRASRRCRRSRRGGASRWRGRPGSRTVRRTRRLVDELRQALAVVRRRTLGGELGRADLQHPPEAQRVAQAGAELAQHVVRVAASSSAARRRRTCRRPARAAPRGSRPRRARAAPRGRSSARAPAAREVALRGQALAGPQQADLDRPADPLDGLLERVGRADRREDRVLVRAE